MTRRILVAEDDKSVRDTMVDLLSEAGFEVQGAREGDEALQLMQDSSFNIVITDLKIPGVDSLQVLEELQFIFLYSISRVSRQLF